MGAKDGEIIIWVIRPDKEIKARSEQSPVMGNI